MNRIITLVLITTVLSHAVAAQELPSDLIVPDSSKVVSVAQKPKANEAILSLSYANAGMSFGLLYKRQLGKRTYLRVGLVDFSAAISDDEPEFTNQFPTKSRGVSGALNLGLEFRFNLHPRMHTYTGVDLVAGGGYGLYMVDNPALPTIERTNETWQLKLGLAFNSGILVDVHKLLRIGINISPNILYSMQPWDYGYNYGTPYKGVRHRVTSTFDTGSVQLFLVIHWDRKTKKERRPPLE
ncbi:MAG: hypothetical protein K9J06_00520 [Flavobacteriales bacterium]|nr:hypothetical protein [Flavobacteriales bacterium]